MNFLRSLTETFIWQIYINNELHLWYSNAHAAHAQGTVPVTVIKSSYGEHINNNNPKTPVSEFGLKKLHLINKSVSFLI